MQKKFIAAIVALTTTMKIITEEKHSNGTDPGGACTRRSNETIETFREACGNFRAVKEKKFFSKAI